MTVEKNEKNDGKFEKKRFFSKPSKHYLRLVLKYEAPS